MELTGEELKFVMFGKKKCPLCGNKLRGATEKDYKGEQFIYPFSNNGIQLIKSKADVYEQKKIYICKNCEKAFALGELIEDGK
jgi:uncharacterized protein (DUF2147 family)